MKKMILSAIAASALFLAPLSARAETGNEAVNKQNVIAFYELAFNQHQPAQAVEKYIGDKYIQHNPLVPNGTAAFTGYFTQYFKDNPDTHVVIYRALADGDLVALHLNFKKNKSDPGMAIVDIFRLENGKIVEHFDVIQQVPEKTANGNTMFSGNNSK